MTKDVTKERRRKCRAVSTSKFNINICNVKAVKLIRLIAAFHSDAINAASRELCLENEKKKGGNHLSTAT